jgi:HK97 family phage prohead protease
MARRHAAAFAGPQRRFWTARDLLARGGLPPQLRADDNSGDTSAREFPDPEWASEGVPTRGHSLVFGKRELIGDPEWGFYEEFAAGSTKKTIGEADIRLLQNHDPNFFLARTKAPGDGMGTYDEHKEDSAGLYHEARMLPTSYAYDLALGLRTGVVSQMSVAFWPMKWELARVDADGKDVADEKRGSMLLVRHLEIALTDESYVTFPAYVDTDASLRVAGMGMLLDAAGQRSDLASRASLIEAVLTGTVRDDAAPMLRAALTALVDLAGTPEPGEPTRESNPGNRYARQRLMLELDMRKRQLGV